MIIFDLDGTLANCEHRRHFVDATQPKNLCTALNMGNITFDEYKKQFKPNWSKFYEACEDDEPIYPTWSCFNTLSQWHNINIWSGRCESVREKTINWLMNRIPLAHRYWCEKTWNHILKMRPIGDNTPDDVLKERWLDEYLSMPIMDTLDGVINKIDFVFDDRPKVVRMWQRRGIFVFNCAQSDKEF